MLASVLGLVSTWLVLFCSRLMFLFSEFCLKLGDLKWHAPDFFHVFNFFYVLHQPLLLTFLSYITTVRFLQQPWPYARRVIFLTSSIRTALHCHPHHQPTPHPQPSTPLPPTPPPCLLVPDPPPSNARIHPDRQPRSVNLPARRRFQIIASLVTQSKAREAADMRPVFSRHRSAKGALPRFFCIHRHSVLFCAGRQSQSVYSTFPLMPLFQVWFVQHVSAAGGADT